MGYLLRVSINQSTKGVPIMTIYQENGFESRKEYLLDLADNMGLDPSIVFALADMLGSNEDFDGLVTSLEDYAVGC